MNFRFKYGKNFLITGLLVLAIYQTGRLWFEDDLSRNFFYSFFGRETVAAEMEEGYSFAMPYRILTNYGNNKFNIAYSGIKDSKARALVDGAIGDVMRNGEYDGEYPLDYGSILSDRSLIYDYAYDVDSEIFTKIFTQKLSLLTSRVAFFNMVIAMPDADSSNIFKLIFVDEENAMAYQYSLDDIALCDSIKQMIQDIQRSSQSTGFYYVSSKLLKIENDRNFFFPRWEGEAMVYNTVVYSTSYYDNGNLTRESLAENIKGLFDNPSSAVYSMSNDVITYSDAYTVVRYYNNDRLEYSNFKVGNNGETSLLEDYSKAVGFINRDKLMINEFYLAGYEENEGTRKFYFDYVVNDFPLLFFAEFKEAVDLSHGIEIEVENGIVVKYMKLAYDYETDFNDLSEANIDILNIIDELNNESIYDIRFGYRAKQMYSASQDQEQTSLFVEIKRTDGADYYRSARTIGHAMGGY